MQVRRLGGYLRLWLPSLLHVLQKMLLEVLLLHMGTDCLRQPKLGQKAQQIRGFIASNVPIIGYCRFPSMWPPGNKKPTITELLHSPKSSMEKESIFCSLLSRILPSSIIFFRSSLTTSCTTVYDSAGLNIFFGHASPWSRPHHTFRSSQTGILP